MIPGTAAWPCGAGPPESAGVLGAARPRPKGPGVAPAADSKAESPSLALATAAVTPGERRQEKRRTPWPWKIFSLDLESLMRVRPPCFLRERPRWAGPGAEPGSACLVPGSRPTLSGQTEDSEALPTAKRLHSIAQGRAAHPGRAEAATTSTPKGLYRRPRG